MTLRVLVADDAILFRRVLTDAINSLPDAQVVGSAENGKVALQKVRELRPDLITLDLEMPEMDGLAVLDALRSEALPVEVLVISALSPAGGALTMRALQKGAFDFITKMDAPDPLSGRQALVRELAPRIRTLVSRKQQRGVTRSAPVAIARPLPAPAPPWVAAPAISAAAGLRPEMVLIGVSTGGPVALSQLLPAVPADLGVPIFLVQHMPPIFTRSLVENLAPKCAVHMREAADGDVPQPNTIYLAPGGSQMRLGAGAGGRPVIQITDDPPENNCKPAVDYLFRSAAHHFPGRAMAVILTGMGNDGTLGLRLLKRRGCYVIAQDEASCVVYGMPRSAVEAGVVDAILPLSAIAARITATVKGTRA
jgi:two-component system chemotaxis response regulator CheB